MTVDVLESRRVEVLKALAEPMRWRIVELLACEELCVCHVVEALDIPQPLVSHHLRVLRVAGLVESERFRQWTYYRLVPGELEAVTDQLARMTSECAAVGDRRRPCC
jgi:ArsR family transcriptional regulator